VHHVSHVHKCLTSRQFRHVTLIHVRDTLSRTLSCTCHELRHTYAYKRHPVRHSYLWEDASCLSVWVTNSIMLVSRTETHSSTHERHEWRRRFMSLRWMRVSHENWLTRMSVSHQDTYHIMGWLRSVGFFKLYVSLAEYSLCIGLFCKRNL